MNLFEIKEEILSLLNEVVDEETGEIIGSEFDFERLNQLEMLQEDKRAYIAKLYKNVTSDAEAYKSLKAEYGKKQSRAEHVAESLKKYLQADLAGEKWEAADKTVKVSYRTTKNKVVVDDLVNIPLKFFKTPIREDNLSKTMIKDIILSGEKVIGAHLEDSVSMSIK